MSAIAIAGLCTLCLWCSPNLLSRSDELLARFRKWDAGINGGKGYSERTSSGGLAWGEADFLRNYMMCYAASGDTYWLSKVVDHFDRMVANLRDPDGDGFLAWSDIVYSVGIARVRPDGDVGGVSISPEEQRVGYRRGGKLATGHTYSIEFPRPDELVVTDATTGTTVAKHKYSSSLTLTDIPGFKFAVKGQARAGARFLVETVAPQPCEFQVHDGMVTYPIALFIETVWTTPALHDQFKVKADRYARLLHDHFLLKWERTWKDVNGAGVYCFSDNPTQRHPGYSLPHNQYLALARTWLVMQSHPVRDRALYRKRAEAMARYFHNHLKPNDGAYVWNYWDPLPGENVGRHIEDFSHATIDISFAIEAYKRGIVFKRSDLLRFARTWTDVMYDGNQEKPRFGANVATRGSSKLAWWEWMQLGQFDRRAYELALLIFDKAGEPAHMVPSVLYLCRNAPWPRG